MHILKTLKTVTRVLLLCSVFACLPSHILSAQSTSGSIVFPKSEMKLKDAFAEIEKQTKCTFAYNEPQVNVDRKVRTDVRGKNLSETLDYILGQSGLQWQINKNKIMVSLQASSASDGRIREYVGTVTDSHSEALPGASVLSGKSGERVVTDIDGRFTISCHQGDTLTVMFLGFRDSKVICGDKTALSVVMDEDRKLLDEAVLVAYGSQRRALITNSISTFKPDENSSRTALSPTELLQGRVAGVNISTSSGNLGTSERMSIRGSSSLSASNQPLYVVDGIPLNNVSGSLYSFGEDLSSLSVLNLSDIESIEILKDAASAAIYGSRGTNGVILITTKQGRDGKSEIKVNYNYGISEFNNRNRIKYADSESWIAVYNEGIDNYNLQNGYLPGNGSYISHITNPYNGLPDTDWLDVITRLGMSHSADVSFTGGTNKTKVYIGSNFTYQEGVIKTNDITKVNLKVNVSHQVAKWLNVGANMSGNYMKNNRVPGAGIGSTIVARAVEQRPFDRPYKTDGGYFLGGSNELSRHNPVQILSEQTSYVNNARYLGSIWAEAAIIDGLKFKASFNTDAGYTYDYIYYNSNHPYKEDNGRIIDKNRFLMTNLVETYFNYDKTWGDWAFGAMAGHSYQKTSSRQSSIDAQNFPSPSFDTVGVAANIAGASGGLSEYAMESWYGRANLSWKDRYVLNATLRADGSSRFAPQHRWGVFPSASLGWNISKEEFWNSLSTELKFRFSYGKTGNQDGISNYGWMPLISGGDNYGGVSGIAVSNKGNENLTWETADQYDFGFDLSFLKGQINMMFDTYLKNTGNLLYNMPMHATSGQTSMLANIGSMRNYGVEFTLNTYADLGPVHWSSSFNIAHNKNELTKLLNDDEVAIGSNHALKVGEEVGSFYLFRFDGIYQYDGEVPTPLYEQGVRAGDIKYYDKDGNGLINDSDRIVVGSPNPDFSGGWNNSFTWKGLNLSVFFTYSYGADVFAAWMQGPTRLGNYQGLLQEWCDNRWTGPGSTNAYPRTIYSYHGYNSKSSTYYLQDASFIKLKSLMLSYTLPQKWTDAMKMKSARIYIQGENLALISKYRGWDPEVSTSLDPSLIGIDSYGVPSPRIYKLGINITF